MLKKGERALLNVLLGVFFKKEGSRCLICFNELYKELSREVKISEEQLKSALKTLEAEDYIDVIYTDRHGEPYLYMALKKRGAGYKAELRDNKNKLLFKLGLAVLSALVTFLAGRILYALFS